jgi:signal transduction histidine kinase
MFVDSKTLILLNQQSKSSKISMRNISLTEKLVLYFLFLGIVVISVISLYAFYSTKQALMNRTFDQLTSLRMVKRNQVEIFFGDRIKDMVLLAHAEETRGIMKNVCLNGSQVKPAQKAALFEDFHRFLKKYHTLTSYFNCIYFCGNNHETLKGSLPAGNDLQIEKDDPGYNTKGLHPCLPEGTQSIMIRDMMIDPESHQPILFIVSPVFTESNERCGWIFLGVSVEAINAMMVNNNPKSGLGLTGETYLVGKDYKLRSSSRFIPNSILKTLVRTQPALEALKGHEGRIITRDYRNIPVLSSYGKTDIPGLDWVILAEIDLKEAMVPIYSMRNSLFLLSILISGVFFVSVYFTTKKITRPIIALRDAAMRIGKGDYDIDLPIRANDEIGALTSAFNTMSLQIRDKTKELQSERIGRLRSVIDAEESERQRLSREIHDGIGQSLIALKLRLESLLYIDGPEIKTNINTLKDQFDGTVDEIRRISNNLMPSVLELFGITIALRNLCVETEEHTGLNILYETSGDLESINTKIKTYIFRIAQEALNNIIKHSGAKDVELNLSRIDEIINFTIRDDGRGFDVETAAFEKGNGLHNMRERVALMEGTIEIRSMSRQGTQIRIQIPVF